MNTPRPLGGQQAQALAQLHAAVAAQRAERVAGEALRVHADHHVGAVADVAHDERDVDEARRLLEGVCVEHAEPGSGW